MSETITLAELTEVLARRHPDKPREAADRLARTLLAIRDGLDDFRQPQASGSTESAREASSSLGADRDQPAAQAQPRDDAKASTDEPHADLLESAWGVIANAGWNDGAKTPGWQEAAERWRDDYFCWSDLHLRPGGYQTWEQLAAGLVRERDALFAEAEGLRRQLRDASRPKAVIREPEGTNPRESFGRLVHDTRLAHEADRAEAEGRERFRLGTWEERPAVQRELDMQIGEVVATAAFHQIRELAKRTGATATGSDGVTRFFHDVMDREGK